MEAGRVAGTVGLVIGTAAVGSVLQTPYTWLIAAVGLVSGAVSVWLAVAAGITTHALKHRDHESPNFTPVHVTDEDGEFELEVWQSLQRSSRRATTRQRRTGGRPQRRRNRAQ